MALFDVVKESFQEFLKSGGISEDTIADLEVNDIKSAHQFLQVGNGNMGKFVELHDATSVTAEVERLLRVKCGQGNGMSDSERSTLATLAPVMPELRVRESKEMLGTFSKKAVHFSEQFPADLSSTEQKQDFSIGQMITKFNTARPGVLKPSARPANQLLNALLQFALSKAGHKDNLYALTSHCPNFAKLAMKAGASDESVGGSDSTLVNKREGSEVEPRSIGAVGKIFTDFLRYAQAMTNVTLPDGNVYGQEAGFIILEECYADYASQRKNVKAVCGALTEGWRRLCDELVTSTEDFTSICKSMKKAGVWVEKDTGKREREESEVTEVKRLKIENERLRKQMANQNFAQNSQNSRLNAGGLVPSNKPCFDFFAGKKCSRNPCPFRHTGEPPSFNPAKGKEVIKQP
jgi:hypothetical protein